MALGYRWTNKEGNRKGKDELGREDDNMDSQNENKRVNKSIFLEDATCPICGRTVYIDDGYGSMESQEYCIVDRNHYRFFSNSFVTTLIVNGMKFDYFHEAFEYIESNIKK